LEALFYFHMLMQVVGDTYIVAIIFVSQGVKKMSDITWYILVGPEKPHNPTHIHKSVQTEDHTFKKSLKISVSY
jgi:hypothetical protein